MIERTILLFDVGRWPLWARRAFVLTLPFSGIAWAILAACAGFLLLFVAASADSYRMLRGLWRRRGNERWG